MLLTSVPEGSAGALGSTSLGPPGAGRREGTLTLPGLLPSCSGGEVPCHQRVRGSTATSEDYKTRGPFVPAIRLPQTVQGLSPACLPPGSCVTLRKPFNWLGRSAPVCRKGNWLAQVSDILLQE